MNFLKQFDTFDPILGEVPDHLFPILPEIAWRARTILKSRTTSQIISLAKELDWAIEEYFRELKESEICRLESGMQCNDERYAQYFEWDSLNSGNGRYLFKDSMLDELDIPTAENTSEVDAIKECLGEWDDLGGEEFPDGKPQDFFAVLSLWLLADTIEWGVGKPSPIVANFQSSKMAELVRQRDPLDHLDKSYRIMMAGQSALKALDAVCHAEHLREVAQLEQAFSSKEITKQAEESKHRSMRTEKLNISRHQNRNEARAKVIDKWQKTPDEWISAAKAGIFLSNWLLGQGAGNDSKPLFDYQPRTVSDWIREHAKKIGVRFK